MTTGKTGSVTVDGYGSVLENVDGAPQGSGCQERFSWSRIQESEWCGSTI